jgi:hypothetical protein
MSYWNTSRSATARQSFLSTGTVPQTGLQATARPQKIQEMWAAKILLARLAAHYACRAYWALQVGCCGGQTGFSARSGETAADNASTAAAIQSNVFFMVNSLLKWKLHRDNVAARIVVRGISCGFAVPENVTT